MELGNNTIQSLSLGNTTISEVWFGNTRVYPTVIVITYTLTNAVMYLSSGSQLLPDRSNYGFIMATLNEYHNGVFYSATTVTCTPQILSSSSSLVDYFSIEGNYIYFNSDYNTTDLYSTYGTAYSTDWVGTSHDVSSSTVYLTTYSNRVESSGITSTNVNIDVTPTTIPSSGGTTTIVPSLSKIGYYIYSSGSREGVVLHDGNITITCNSSAITTTAQHETAISHSISSTISTSETSYVFTASYSGISASQTIVQEAADFFITLTPDSISVDSGGTSTAVTHTIAVTTNLPDWNVSTDYEWITATKNTVMNVVEYTVAPNIGTKRVPASFRIGSIKVYYDTYEAYCGIQQVAGTL